MQSLSRWRSDLDTLAHRVAQLDTAVRQMQTLRAVPVAQEAFLRARLSFKRVELALTYYMPSTAQSMNMPALPEVEESEGPETVMAPTGFQVLEEGLYGDAPLAAQAELVQEVITLQQLVRRAQTMLAPQLVTDDRVWDAAKLEIARISTLGVTGFDSPIAGHSFPEAAAALNGLLSTLEPYRSADSAWTRFDSLMVATTAVLTSNPERDRFDFLGLIAHQLRPLAEQLIVTRSALGIGVPVERRAFRVASSSVFDRDAFDVLAFAPLDTKNESVSRVELGRSLFNDARLSGDGSRTCGSCHIPEKAFADGQRTSRGRRGQPLPRNTPTILNIGLQVGSFADLRTMFLEDQVTEVVQNDEEMHARLSDVVTSLARDSALSVRFTRAFADETGRRDSSVTGARIRGALAAYMRSLTRLNSPVDRALRGDTLALNTDARAGFNLFVGKGKCATCHFLPLTNGTVPPMYQKSEVEVIGVPVRADTMRARIDPDVGRYRLSRAAPHLHAFRTPSLRNVALTAPYMHNGAYATLESVIDFYNRGGGAGIGVTLDHQTLPADRLRLSASEQRSLVQFLRALTDTAGTTARQ